ncbi:MAG: hypothetical protein J5933_04075, partial [Clostridia bacterium]|nr:hypothetical protein [Clostridia bacterium]
MKKTICLVLSLVLLFLLVSCSAQNSGDNNPDGSPDSTGNDSGTPANDGTTIYYVPDDLPDTINYNGEKVVFLTLADSLFRYDVLTDELNSEPVNDSVFNRERFVEERLGVDITDEKVSGNDFLTKVNIQNSSNDDTYQIYAESTVWFASTVFDGYLTDLYELDYIDFSKPWWSELFNNEAELGGRLFMTTGSLSLSTNRFLYTFYYNKKLAEDYSNSYPDLSNLY